jgi:hypothetical protein
MRVGSFEFNLRELADTLGAMLALQGIKMIGTWWALGAASLLVVLLLRRSRYAPASIVLFSLWGIPHHCP